MWGRAMVRRAAGIGTGAALVLAATACSFSFSLGGSSVDKDEVAAESARMLEQQVGQSIDDMTCPEDLPAEVGASIRCELTADGTTLGVTVTTTQVDGSDVEFAAEVDERPAD